jgi:hypothetical protein
LDAEGAQILGYKKAEQRLSEIHKDINNGNDPLIKIGDNELTVNNGMHVYAHSKDPDSFAHLLGTGLTEENIAAIVRALPEKNKKAVEEMWKYFKTEERPRLNKAFIKDHQVEMPNSDYYMPIRGLVTSQPENAIFMDIMTRYGANRASLEKGFLKGRVHSDSPFGKMDYFGTLDKHVHDVEHYLAYNDFVTGARKILGNQEVKEALMAKNPDAYNELNMWLDRITRGKETSIAGPIDKVSDLLRTNSSISILGGLVSAVLKQPASLFNGIAHIRPSYTVKASFESLKNPFKLNEFINGKDPLMLGRAKSYERELAELGEKGSAARTFRIQDIQQGIKETANTIGEKSMVPMAALDKATANIVWYGKYLEVLNDTGNEVMAIKAARELVTKTQSMGGIVHAARSFTGGGVNRAFSTFLNQPNQNLNIMLDMAMNWGKQDMTTNAAQLFGNFFAPVVVTYLASNGYDPAKIASDPEGFVEEGISNLASGIPFFGIGINYAVHQAANKIRETQARPVQRRDAELVPVSFSVFKDIKDLPTKPVESAINIAGKLTGLPVKQAITTVKGVKTAVAQKSVKPLLFTKYALRPQDVESFKGKAAYLDRIKKRYKELVDKGANTDEFAKKYAKYFSLINTEETRGEDEMPITVEQYRSDISEIKKTIQRARDAKMPDVVKANEEQLKRIYANFNLRWKNVVGD